MDFAAPSSDINLDKHTNNTILIKERFRILNVIIRRLNSPGSLKSHPCIILYAPTHANVDKQKGFLYNIYYNKRIQGDFFIFIMIHRLYMKISSNIVFGFSLQNSSMILLSIFPNLYSYYVLQ